MPDISGQYKKVEGCVNHVVGDECQDQCGTRSLAITGADMFGAFQAPTGYMAPMLDSQQARR
jgi:hypothetical protein